MSIKNALLSCLLMLPLMQLSAATSQIVANPSVIDDTTTDLNLLCDVVAGGKVDLVGAVTILKYSGPGWESVASMSYDDISPVTNNSSASATGHISDDGYSELTVKLPISLHPEGKYKCQTSGTYSDKAATEFSDTIEIKSTVSEDDCCEPVKNTISKRESPSGSASGGYCVLHSSVCGVPNEGDNFLRTQVWPVGLYGLLSPETGCPSMGFSFIKWHDKGYRQIHTESGSPQNKDEVSPGSHLKQPIAKKNGENYFKYFYFCMNLDGAAKGPEWPRGSYCIFRYGACPTGFHNGYMIIDEENYLHSNKWLGPVPTGAYGADTILHYCCRRDAQPFDPVYLPTSKPFYLFRFDGECQQVAGMKVTNEYIVLDTEDDGVNIDRYENDYHPDGSLSDVRIELCYYE